MSDYGMQVFNEIGQTRLSITDRTFRLVATFTASAGASGSVYVPGLSSKAGVFPFASVINQSTTGFNLPHEVYISGDYIGYYPGQRNGSSVIWVYVTA